MKNFGLYGLMLFACGIMGLIVAAMFKYSLWYAFALFFPIPTWWVSFSIFKTMVSEETKKYKTCFILIGYLVLFVFGMVIGMLFIGTTSFFGLTFAWFLILSGTSTILLIFNIINEEIMPKLKEIIPNLKQKITKFLKKK